MWWLLLAKNGAKHGPVVVHFGPFDSLKSEHTSVIIW